MRRKLFALSLVQLCFTGLSLNFGTFNILIIYISFLLIFLTLILKFKPSIFVNYTFSIDDRNKICFIKINKISLVTLIILIISTCILSSKCFEVEQNRKYSIATAHNESIYSGQTILKGTVIYTDDVEKPQYSGWKCLVNDAHLINGEIVNYSKYLLVSYSEKKLQYKNAYGKSNRYDELSQSKSLKYPKPKPGEVIETEIKVELPVTARNPRCFNYRKFLESQGIYLIGKCKSYSVINCNNNLTWRLKRFTEDIRENFLDHLIKLDKTHDIAALVRGIVLGDKSQIDEDNQEMYRRYGTGHILAVSGLHVGILIFLFKKVNRLCPNHVWHYLAFLTLTLYGEVTRWSPSVTRAIIMAVMYIISDFIGKDTDLITSLGVAGLVSICINPASIISPGFHMSYLAILGIGILFPVIFNKIRNFCQKSSISWIRENGGGNISGWVAIYLAIQAVLGPYIVYKFNILPLWGVMINLPVTFIAGLIVQTGVVSLVFQALNNLILPYIGDANFMVNILGTTIANINRIIWGLGKALQTIHIWMTSIIDKDINISSFNKGFLVFTILVVLFIASESIRIAYLRRKHFLIIIFMMGIFLLSTWVYFDDLLPFDKASVIMVDVGQGDCLHVKTKDGINIIFDGGGSKDVNIGKRILMPYLLKNRVNKIDIAAITHEDIDHSQGIKDLNEVFSIETVLFGRCESNLIRHKNLKLDVLWPEESKKEIAGTSNNLSSVYRIEADGIVTIVTGDIDSKTEKELVKKYKNTDVLSADILKISHHGSKYSTSNELIDAVNPRIALIGVGKNLYGHPDTDVIDKLHKNGIMVYRTDRHGAIGIRKEKDKLKVCTMLKSRVDIDNL
ncbi:DNA internalization-related competence protein ComEC/Rec2 [Eubacteriales bacterium KG127]